MKILLLHKDHWPLKEHRVSQGRVGRKAEIMRECYRSPLRYVSQQVIFGALDTVARRER